MIDLIVSALRAGEAVASLAAPFSAPDLEMACCWPGAPGALASAMEACGMITPTPAGYRPANAGGAVRLWTPPAEGIEYPHFPVKGGVWLLTEKEISRLSAAHPGAGVEAELRSAHAWTIENPKGRKTARGMTSFLGSWLRRAFKKKRPAAPRPSILERMRSGRSGRPATPRSSG